MLKRMIALALALSMLLAGAAACAESVCTRLDISKMKVSLVGSENKDVARLHNMSLCVIAGSVENIPTFQAILDYGDGQELDSVLQVVGTRLVMCFGGLSGTYYVDLATLLGEEQGKLVATAIGGGLMMFGANPDLVLSMAMPANAKGIHSKTFSIKRKSYLPLAETLLDAVESTGAMPQETLDGLREGLNQSRRKLKIKVRFNPGKGKLRLRVTRDGKGYYLRANATLTTEPMQLINVSADEEQYDLLAMDAGTLDNLRDELDFLQMKLDSFVENSNLRKLEQ